MSHSALLVLAAESSKTAFYAGGGVLAAWAVLLAAIGLSRPEFPRTEGAARGVYGISLLLTAAAAITAIATG